MHTKENWFLFSVSRCVIELLCDLKAKQLGTKQLDEDSLFQLIESLPAKKSKYEVLAEKEAAKVTLQTFWYHDGSVCCLILLNDYTDTMIKLWFDLVLALVR